MKKIRILSTSDLCTIALFVALISLCSWICIPLAVPVTMQIFGVFSACAYLGLKRGVICVTSYIALGAVGVPVFSGFRGGVGHLLGNTGGFIFGFIIAVIVIGVIMKNREFSFISLFFSMSIALLCCYIVGILWFIFISFRNYTIENIVTGFLTFLPLFLIDFIKIFVASTLMPKIKRIGESANI